MHQGTCESSETFIPLQHNPWNSLNQAEGTICEAEPGYVTFRTMPADPVPCDPTFDSVCKCE